MILAGDVGGTKTVLALFEREGDVLTLTQETVLHSPDYASLEAMLTETLKPQQRFEAACFGVAGPVVAGRSQITNLPWLLEEAALKSLLGVSHLRLLNDLEAMAYGMLYLGPDQFASLNPDGEQTGGNRAVIAAGTGLGEAILYWDGSAYAALASEGGHCDFAPGTPQQDALLQFLRDRFKGHVSFERVLSGPGIVNLYDFLRETQFAPEAADIPALFEQHDPAAIISQRALEGRDTLCIEALRLFCEIYGAEAGNLALKGLATGGVYLGGGIAPKVLPFLQQGDFLRAFTAKGRFEHLLKRMEVRVALELRVPLWGAAYYALRLAKG